MLLGAVSSNALAPPPMASHCRPSPRRHGARARHWFAPLLHPIFSSPRRSSCPLSTKERSSSFAPIYTLQNTLIHRFLHRPYLQPPAYLSLVSSPSVAYFQPPDRCVAAEKICTLTQIGVVVVQNSSCILFSVCCNQIIPRRSRGRRGLNYTDLERAEKMACFASTGAGMAGVLASSELSSRSSFSSQLSGLSGACVPVSVVSGALAVRAGEEPSGKSLEVMRKFSEQYARKSDTFFCVDKGVTAVVVKGLAEHKDTLGAPLCPCRHYDDKMAEVQQGFWNCPCVPMRERKECHCMLFLTSDNDFAGTEQEISLEEISELTKSN